MLFGLVLAALIVITALNSVRIVTGLRADVAGRGARSTEERYLQDALAAVKQDPNSLQARWQLSIALSTVGEYSRAQAEAEQAVKLDEESVEAFYALGVAYRGLRDNVRAEKALAKSAGFPGSHSEIYREVYYELGEVRSELGDAQGAVTAFQGALGNGPEATYIVVRLAQAYLDVGETERAKEEFLAVLGYDPENEIAETALLEMGVGRDEIDAARDPIAHQDDNS